MNFTARCLAALALSFCSAISCSVQAAALKLEECRLQSSTAHAAATARCGELSVPENREQKKAVRQIALHVAVIPALRVTPKPDPLFILSGGPGQAASDFYLATAPAFARIRRERDIVLLDQRGTGRSNRLDCEWSEDSELLAQDPEVLRRAASDCLTRLPGDPRYYTTSVAVRDLDEVRAALGYERINLYGVSYGTRVAQHYMRRFPTRTRAAILDGVAPPGLALGPETAVQVQRALDLIFARCAGDARCAQAFPDTAQQLSALRTRLEETPAQLVIPDPQSAQPTNVTLGAQHLAAVVRLLAYTDETASILPIMIHEAQVARREQALAAQYLIIRRTLSEQFAQGMHYAVVCSEDAPRWPALAGDAAIDSTLMGAEFMQAMRAICSEWPRGEVDADFGAPLTTDTPVLVLSGGVDPATPASYAERILPGLSNARHLVLEGQGHGQIGTGCIPRLAAEFIDAASAAALDVACVRNVAPAPFMLSLTAPAP